LSTKHKNKYFKQIDLWPIGSNKSLFNNKEKKYTIDEFEIYLKKLYNSKAYPLVVSSARNAINLCLISLDYNKSNNISLFPYASKCIKNKVNEVTNISNDVGTPSIVHHYCGITNKCRINDTIIEDSVDTLMSSHGSFFQSNGLYEIWSLNKIFGSIGGAIIWSKDKKLYNKIKKIRDKNSFLKNTNMLFKYIFFKPSSLYQFYMSREIKSYVVPDCTASYYKSFFDNIDFYIDERKKKIELFKDLVNPNYIHHSRFPSIIAIEDHDLIKKILKKYEFMYNYRHIEVEMKENKNIVKVLPIPIHQQVSFIELKKLREYIDAV
jgi:putative PLP-dependent aminotransferase (TIGR04422 family)